MYTELLRRVVLGYYAPEAFSEAKKILMHELQLLVSSCPFVADRRNSSGRAAHEAELEDILYLPYYLASLMLLMCSVDSISISLLRPTPATYRGTARKN